LAGVSRLIFLSFLENACNTCPGESATEIPQGPRNKDLLTLEDYGPNSSIRSKGVQKEQIAAFLFKLFDYVTLRKVMSAFGGAWWAFAHHAPPKAVIIFECEIVKVVIRNAGIVV
jgi:hypothetical protein